MTLENTKNEIYKKKKKKKINIEILNTEVTTESTVPTMARPHRAT